MILQVVQIIPYPLRLVCQCTVWCPAGRWCSTRWRSCRAAVLRHLGHRCPRHRTTPRDEHLPGRDGPHHPRPIDQQPDPVYRRNPHRRSRSRHRRHCLHPWPSARQHVIDRAPIFAAPPQLQRRCHPQPHLRTAVPHVHAVPIALGYGVLALLATATTIVAARNPPQRRSCAPAAGSRNVSRMRARETEVMSAAPVPCTIRVATRTGRLGAPARAAEGTTKTIMPRR